MVDKEKVLRETLERYTGSEHTDFQPIMLLTNFAAYLEYFAKSRNVQLFQGSMFGVAHDPSINVTMMDIKLGSPAASLAIDLLQSIPLNACIFLGMCGGLREHYLVGDYFLPIAAIRAEGTSDFYFDRDVPALGNFVVEKAISIVLDERQLDFHKGIVYTTNKRFWEFNDEFKVKLKRSGSQGIEMECATLFTSSYYYRIPLAALLLVSDLPLRPQGIKTKKSMGFIFDELLPEHIMLGIETAQKLNAYLEKKNSEFSRKELFY